MSSEIEPSYPAKDRALYVILAVLVGFSGAHNFYAARIGQALSQLALGVMGIVLLTMGYGKAWICLAPLAAWIVHDVFRVKP